LNSRTVEQQAEGRDRFCQPLAKSLARGHHRESRPLETSVFAIGDVRAGSMKRVAASVGEGAQVVATLHSALAAVGRWPLAIAND
jgi:hypothetical protein